jgi:hypothetical protein
MTHEDGQNWKLAGSFTNYSSSVTHYFGLLILLNVINKR